MNARNLCGLSLLVLSLQAAWAVEPAPATARYSHKSLLKNWALSRCLGQAYGVKTVEEDAYRTAGAYFEFSRLPVERFDSLSALVEKYLRADYRGSIEGSYNTMKCIDLFHSRELDRLSERLARRGR